MEELQVIHKNGQPYGIRDKGGYLLFFPQVTKYNGQEERYTREIKEVFDLAEKIMKALRTPDVVGRSEQLICPCCGSDRTYKTEAIHCNRCAVTTEI